MTRVAPSADALPDGIMGTQRSDPGSTAIPPPRRCGVQQSGHTGVHRYGVVTIGIFDSPSCHTFTRRRWTWLGGIYRAGTTDHLQSRDVHLNRTLHDPDIRCIQKHNPLIRQLGERGVQPLRDVTLPAQAHERLAGDLLAPAAQRPTVVQPVDPQTADGFHVRRLDRLAVPHGLAHPLPRRTVDTKPAVDDALQTVASMVAAEPRVHHALGELRMAQIDVAAYEVERVPDVEVAREVRRWRDELHQSCICAWRKFKFKWCVGGCKLCRRGCMGNENKARLPEAELTRVFCGERRRASAPVEAPTDTAASRARPEGGCRSNECRPEQQKRRRLHSARRRGSLPQRWARILPPRKTA
ncbi:TetR family transcriptional regulator [Babesia caballi]|uniref:TetR family transcriptional regulator n=1 Tax=Babesia caballi TaxID=5871 RepID=A0AAV4LME9_BABCB|nr:TetR family transcriptional regulator [Babesia caballi]